MNTTTAASIRTDAATYNAEYMCPELADALTNGAPVLDVATHSNSNRTLRIVFTPGLRFNGKFIAAADPVSINHRVRDGRDTPEQIVGRFTRTRFAGLAVPVEVRNFF